MNTILPNQGIPDLAPVTPQSTSSASQQNKVGLTDAVLASEKADTAFSLTMAIRNKALSAYQEIMNLSV
jgi:flagellar hook-basal body complex protein FliE